MKYLDRILNENGEVLAIILREKYSQNGIEFFTPDDFPQQLGYMKHKRPFTTYPSCIYTFI